MEETRRGSRMRLKSIISALPYTNIAITLLLVGVCLFVYTAQKGLQSIEQIKLHNDASRQALQNTILIGETMSLLKDIETGQRGYIITGNESFLTPYYAARDRFGETYRKLVDNLEKSQDERYPHARLDKLVEERIEHARFLIDERRVRGREVLDDVQIYLDGKVIMDEIRREVAHLQADQQALSAKRNQQARDIQERSFNLNFWITIGGTLIMILSSLLLIREKRIRDRAQKKLHDTNTLLEVKIAERTAELQAVLERLQVFAIEQEQNIEAERRRMAREVHDQLGQVFTSLKLVLIGVKVAPPEKIPEKAEELTHLLDDGIMVARRISSELRPPLLDDFGLAAAAEHYGQTFTKRGGPVMTVNIEHDGMLNALQANQLFRILQEAATNVLRHAQADSILIDGNLDGDDVYRFTITDNGIGPQPIRSDASGVRNMRERATLVGGSFEFGPAPGKGTRITVCIPLVQEDA